MTESASYFITTFLLAWWGAFVATALAVLRFIEFLADRRPRVRVSLSLALVGPGLPDEKPVWVFTLDAANAGTRPVTLKLPAIRVPRCGELAFPRPFHSNGDFPRELTEGASCSFIVEAERVAHLLHREGFRGRAKLVAVFRDTLGGEHTSKPLAVTADHLYREFG